MESAKMKALTPEQQKAVHALTDLCLQGDKVSPSDLGLIIREVMVDKALIVKRGNQTAAADMLEMNRLTLRKVARDMGYAKQGDY